MSTIRSDVADTETTASEEFDATSAFYASLGADDEDAGEENKRKPSEAEEDEEGDEPNNETDPEGETEGDEGSDESPEADEEDGEPGDKEKAFADDGAYVKLKVDGVETEVAVKDLTRLYGQEAALTRKSQEVADQRKQAEAESQKYAASLQVLLNRASEKAAPFEKIDWLALAKDPSISAEEASALRVEAQKAFEEREFLSQNLNGFMQEVQKQQHNTRVESAKACVTALTTKPSDDKPNGLYIEGWNDKTYDAVREFAVKTGMPADMVNSIVDPAAIKMMHMAMQFAKGTSKVVTTQKVNKTPKKIVKTSSSPVASRQDAPTANRKAAIKALKANPNKSGAAADAFFASFGDDD